MPIVSQPRRRIRQVLGSVLAVLATAALAQLPAPAQAQAQTLTAAAAAAPSAVPASAPAKSATHTKKTSVATQPQPPAQPVAMDLHAPPLDHIYPRGELQYILAMDSSDSDADAQEVSVKGAKYVTPVPVGQFQAIPWALMHPTEAWRVFTPVEQP